MNEITKDKGSICYESREEYFLRLRVKFSLYDHIYPAQWHKPWPRCHAFHNDGRGLSTSYNHAITSVFHPQLCVKRRTFFKTQHIFF